MCAVVLACRDTERGLLVAKEVEAAQVAAGFPAQTQVVALDQSSVESAEECANEFLATNTALHILINNGGIYDMGGMYPESFSDFLPQHCSSSPPVCATLSKATTMQVGGNQHQVDSNST